MKPFDPPAMGNAGKHIRDLTNMSYQNHPPDPQGGLILLITGSLFLATAVSLAALVWTM